MSYFYQICTLHNQIDFPQCTVVDITVIFLTIVSDRVDYKGS